MQLKRLQSWFDLLPGDLLVHVGDVVYSVENDGSVEAVIGRPNRYSLIIEISGDLRYSDMRVVAALEKGVIRYHRIYTGDYDLIATGVFLYYARP